MLKTLYIFNLSILGDAVELITITGPQSSCKLNTPTATAVLGEMIYVSTLSGLESSYQFYSSPANIFSIKFNTDFRFREVAIETVTKPTTKEPKREMIGNVPCPSCIIKASIEDLESVPLDFGDIGNITPISFIYEDKYHPGVVYFNWGNGVAKYEPGKPVENFIGQIFTNRSDMFSTPFSPGNSSSVILGQVSDIVQYNETWMLLADFFKNCIVKFDLEANTVDQFIGECLLTENHFPLIKEEGQSANTNFAQGVNLMLHVTTQDILLIVDFSYREIVRYEFSTHTVRRLDEKLADKLPNPFAMILNSDETLMYVGHSYGISKMDMNTLEVTLLVGSKVAGDADVKIPFHAGAFSAPDTKVGLISSLDWLVQDELLIGTSTRHNELILFVDLRSEKVYSACEGEFTFELKKLSFWV